MDEEAGKGRRQRGLEEWRCESVHGRLSIFRTSLGPGPFQNIPKETLVFGESHDRVIYMESPVRCVRDVARQTNERSLTGASARLVHHRELTRTRDCCAFQDTDTVLYGLDSPQRTEGQR